MNAAHGEGRPPSRLVRARARLRPKSQLTLPEQIRQALHVGEGDELEFAVQDDGTVTVRGYVSVPADQLWRYRASQDDGPGTSGESTVEHGRA